MGRLKAVVTACFAAFLAVIIGGALAERGHYVWGVLFFVAFAVIGFMAAKQYWQNTVSAPDSGEVLGSMGDGGAIGKTLDCLFGKRRDTLVDPLDPYHRIREIPASERKKKTVATAAFTLVTTVIVVGYSALHDNLSGALIFSIPFSLVGLMAARRYWTRTVEVLLTDHGKERQLQEEYEARQTRDEFWNGGVIRYLTALGCFSLAGYLLYDNPDAWLAPAALAVVGALKAIEITLVIIVIALIVLAFKFVSTLPVSIAVVLGAIIIASAIAK